MLPGVITLGSRTCLGVGAHASRGNTVRSYLDQNRTKLRLGEAGARCSAVSAHSASRGAARSYVAAAVTLNLTALVERGIGDRLSGQFPPSRPALPGQAGSDDTRPCGSPVLGMVGIEARLLLAIPARVHVTPFAGATLTRIEEGGLASRRCAQGQFSVPFASNDADGVGGDYA